MSGTAISNLPAASSALSTDLIPAVEVGSPNVTKRVTVTQLQAGLLPTTGGDLSGPLVLENAVALQAEDNTDAIHNLLVVDASNNTNLYNAGGGTLQFNAQAGTTEGSMTNAGVWTLGGVQLASSAITANAVTYNSTAGHAIAFGWNGTNLLGYVDGTGTPGALATVAYVSGTYATTSYVNSTFYTASYVGANFATYSYVSSNFYSTSASDARYLFKTGDTCTGTLNINGSSTIGGSVVVGGNLQVNTNFDVYGAATFHAAINSSGTGTYLAPTFVQTTPVGWNINLGLACNNAIVAQYVLTNSDRRVKDNIRTISYEDGVEWVMLGRPCSFELDGKPSAGFIAQEDLQNVRCKAVGGGPSSDVRVAESDGVVAAGHLLTRDYNQDVPYHEAVLQGLLKKVAALEAEVNALRRVA